MARLSKSQQFRIYTDAGIPTPDSEYQRSFDDEVIALGEIKTQSVGGHVGVDEGGGDADDEGRRTSGCSATSISSLPESAWQTDDERASLPAPKSYSSHTIRPSFRRPESVRRLQLSSPPPFGLRSPRHSVVRHSRAGTPQPRRSAAARGSPKPRRRISDATAEPEEQCKVYPLILLHITLLPVTQRWSAETMQRILPRSILDSLQLLRSKVTDLVLQRGLLILHPGDEYELLEERLLEALELQEERITKCGHFRTSTRQSLSSMSGSTSVSDSDRSDSGLGSSVEALSDVGDICETCHHPLRATRPGTCANGGKWSVKVYAANGLMRASAWAAAWSEMERVDVEILPWISDDMIKRLDAGRREDDAEESKRQEVEGRQMAAAMERQESLMQESLRAQQASHQEAVDQPTNADKAAKPVKVAPPKDDLPQVYRPSQIPVSVLIKNYIFLLAQDRRNVAICFLVAVAIWLGLLSIARPAPVGLDPAAGVTNGVSTSDVLEMPVQSHMTAEIEHGASVYRGNGTEEILKDTGVALGSEESLTLNRKDDGLKQDCDASESTIESRSMDEVAGATDRARRPTSVAGAPAVEDEAYFEVLEDVEQAHFGL